MKKYYGMVHRVILIEDDAALNESLVLSLERSGYMVDSFLTITDFEKASQPPPDIYLIDRHLNGLDGLDLCRDLKSQEATKNIPVIIMSANPEVALISQDGGANGFLDKPFTRRQLVELLNQFLPPIS